MKSDDISRELTEFPETFAEGGKDESGGADSQLKQASVSDTPATSEVSQGFEEAEESEEGGFTHEGRLEEYEQDDPMAPAFDLEHGSPLRGENVLDHDAPTYPHRSKIKSAKEFFNTEILYRFDILEDHERVDLRGDYRIELRGFQGGVWTIRIGDVIEVVNRREDAEISIVMQQRDFLQLVNGTLNPQLAIFAQKMRITGDLRKAILFQLILTPSSD